MGRNNLAGAWGEALAARYLEKKRYKLVAANYRSRFGEIDLIVRSRTHLVFVEVKLRKSDRFARASEFVDQRKQERLRTTAAMYLSENPTELFSRFDVIEIYAPDGVNTQNPEIFHMEDAFQ
jgi:putative endonuclease